jgi:four helix bundle protein
MKTYGFEKLTVWQDAKNFAIEIYHLTGNFPSDEKFGLISQLRRAIISVTSNIAEGSSRSSRKDQSHFYTMAFSSLIEVLSQLIISKDLGYLNDNQLIFFREEVEKVSNKLNALRKSIE